ncbi:MAG: glycosyltransferase family 4 protein [Pseudomonadota bacterium]|nr:glycosyltransferase family 4 protein [Pseudomonadota bacterium]
MEQADAERPGPALWIDVEDMFDYFRFNPHPSGIQRVALDIMAALTVVAPGRVRFGRHADGAKAGTTWREVRWSEIEAMVASPTLEPLVEKAEDDQARRSRVQRTIHALPPELRDPLFRAGVLQSQVLRNVRALIHLVRPPPPVEIRDLPSGEALTAVDGPQAGDVVVVLGAPWSVRGAGLRMAALKAAGVRSAVLIHDLIPVRRPEWFPASRVERFRAWLDAALRQADHLLTISRFTAADVAAYAARSGIEIAPPTVLRAGASRLRAALEMPPGLPIAGSYVLFVSTLEARKNHVLLLRVWQRLMAEVRAGSRAPGSVPQLVFAGRVGTGVADLLQQLDNSRYLGGRVRLLREPGDAEIRALYQGCLFSILPSLFEGWGLPLGESLALGKPCLAARGTALEEAGGDLCRYFDPEDVGDAHRAVTALLDTPGAIHLWQADIRARYRPENWNAAAAAIVGLAG